MERPLKTCHIHSRSMLHVSFILMSSMLLIMSTDMTLVMVVSYRISLGSPICDSALCMLLCDSVAQSWQANILSLWAESRHL